MPRRQPPSPLRLFRGPTPPRSAPRHSIPAIPRPTFHPAPSSSSSSPTLDHESASSPPPPTLPAPVALAALGRNPLHTMLHVLPEYTPRPALPIAPITMLGPWDRTRRMSWTEDEIRRLVPEPEPAVANPSPVSW